MPNWHQPRSGEIDRKLRDDFRRLLLHDFGITTQETDPILAVLFRSLAVQIEDVYGQAAEHIPLAVLDELMAGLGMPERHSRPAQSIIRFSLQKGRQWFEPSTELIGDTQSKERLTFALDTPIAVSPAALSLVAIYQDGTLQFHRGTDLPKTFEDARPSFEAVTADLGPHPAIYAAIDVSNERHLSHHGLYVELAPETQQLLRAVQRETWCLLDTHGVIQALGMLRSRAGNVGVRHLEWLVADAALTETTDAAYLPEGSSRGHTFIGWLDGLAEHEIREYDKDAEFGAK